LRGLALPVSLLYKVLIDAGKMPNGFAYGHVVLHVANCRPAQALLVQTPLHKMIWNSGLCYHGFHVARVIIY
jgi:hypothetical protein